MHSKCEIPVSIQMFKLVKIKSDEINSCQENNGSMCNSVSVAGVIIAGAQFSTLDY